MANVNAPFGFRPVQMTNGSPWSGEANVYAVLAANNQTIRIGDLVKYGGSSDANGIPTVALATVSAGAGTGNAGDSFLGAVVGVLPVGTRAPTSLVGTALSLESKTILITESALRYVLVCDSANVVYEVKSGATGLSSDGVGSNVNFVATTADTDKLSEFVLNDTPNTTNTFPFKLIGFSSKPNNEISTTPGTVNPHVVCLVRPNEHAFRVGQVGLAV